MKVMDKPLIIGKQDRSKGEITKENIFKTAVNLFSKNGYSGVSIRDITGTIGIKESSLYHYYESKRELLKEIYSYFTAELNGVKMPCVQVTDNMTGDDGIIMLQGCLVQYRRVMEAPTMAKIWRIITMEQFRDEEAFYIISILLNKSRLIFYESIFREMMKCKMIKPTDPGQLALEYVYSFIGMFSEYNILKYYEKNTSDIEKQMLNI